MQVIPTLETPRLLLTAHTLADLEDAFAMWSDPEVTRHIGGRPSTRGDVWSRILRYVGHWTLLDFGYWALRDRSTGAFLGDVGLADFRRDLDPPFGDAPEAGWALTRAAQGRGLATEAMRAVLAWRDASLPGASTMCMIDPPNLASIRVADKCGFTCVGERMYRGEPSLIYERVTTRAES